MSPAAVDRGWPHQVALPEKLVVARFREIQAFAGQLSLAARGHSVTYDGQSYSVYCFAVAEDAERFRMAFDGAVFNPKDRGRGNRWWQWNRPKG